MHVRTVVSVLVLINTLVNLLDEDNHLIKDKSPGPKLVLSLDIPNSPT